MSVIYTSGTTGQAKPVLLPFASLGELFIGRDDDLARLQDSLNRGAGAAITSGTRSVES